MTYHRPLCVVAALAACFSADVSHAQEVPKVGTGKAVVHQWGILRTGEMADHHGGGNSYSITPLSADALLDIPDFVHTAPAPEHMQGSWLDYSALYFNPPHMMGSHLALDVTMGLPHITAWYPYAHETTSTRERVWRNVLVGVQADGLETTHPQWMKPRAVEAAATVKVYKPGPPGTKPDDVGTTEGDVYMFLRGPAGGDGIHAGIDAVSGDWFFSQQHVPPGSPALFDESNHHAWLAEALPGDEIICRPLKLDISATTSLLARAPRLIEKGRSSLGMTIGPADVDAEGVTRTALDLQVRMNEALVGHGLRGDEAGAQSALILESIRKARGPVLIYILRQEWTDLHFPLKIDGPAEKPVRVFAVVKSLPATRRKR